MSFIEQTSRLFGDTAEFKFKAVLFGRDAIYIENARAIKIDENEMIFKAAGAVIKLSGERLSVLDLAEGSAAIVGRIRGFSVDDL